MSQSELEIPQLINSIIQNGGTPNQWTDLSNQINTNAIKSKIFVSEIKKLLKDNSPTYFLIILNLVDYIVDECSLTLHTQISSRDFITTMLILLKLKDYKEIQEKVLILIKKWGIKFENQRDVLPNFFETYNSLKKNGIVFPTEIKNDYMKYLSNNDNDFNPFNSIIQGGNRQDTSSSIKDNNSTSINTNQSKITTNNQKSDKETEINQGNIINFTPNYGDICLPLDLDRYPKEYHSLIVELMAILENIMLENELINYADYKAKQVDETVKDMFIYIKSMSQNIKQAIESQIENEDIMMICLGVSEDIEKVMYRFEQLSNHIKPSPFVSVFKTEYTQYDLMQYNQIKQSQDKTQTEVKSNEPISQKESHNENLLSFDIEPINIQLDNMNVNPQNDSNKEKQDIKTSANQIKDINDIFDFTNQK